MAVLKRGMALATTHPYIPNASPRVRKQMLRQIGVESIDELFSDIPDEMRLKNALDLPEPLLSEYALSRHVNRIMSKNTTCSEYTRFLGAGCYNHYVPAVCDEIAGRGEFLTAYTGDTYEDHGRWQALFEYASLVGELVSMDVVSVPTYDFAQAAATSLCMAARITGRKHAVIAGAVSRERRGIIEGYSRPTMNLDVSAYNPLSGEADRRSLESLLTADTAAVYVETPNYFGVIDKALNEIREICDSCGALLVVGQDPICLGLFRPAASFGADIVCGDLQVLGNHMNYGGGLSGFIATRDEPRYVMQYPSRLVGITPTLEEGEFGFGEVAFSRTSFIEREHGREYVGTGTSLLAIISGVYLALMGPQGMRQLALGIMQRTAYAARRLNSIPGVRSPALSGASFREIVVNFDGTSKSVKQVNEALLERRIIGGKDISEEFCELGQSALYCITEMHTKQDIDALVDALTEVLS